MIRALIVDDKPENLLLLRSLLQGHGYGVEEARHGAEALAKARQAPPQLVISDLLMPVMDGYTLLRHWKADRQLKTIPFIVYTTTYTQPKDEKLALDLGADAFILKPAEPEPCGGGKGPAQGIQRDLRCRGTDPLRPAHRPDRPRALIRRFPAPPGSGFYSATWRGFAGLRIVCVVDEAEPYLAAAVRAGADAVISKDGFAGELDFLLRIFFPERFGKAPDPNE